MRTVAALMVLIGLGACSGSTDEEPGGWKKDALADGRLTFEMPGPALHGRGEAGLVSAKCSDDACEYSIFVHKSEKLAKRMGTTEKEHLRWAGFYLLGIIQGEEDRSIEDEGEWTQGKLVGKWKQLALPATPPERMVPIYRWLYAAAWEGQAIRVVFDATQAAYDSDVYGPAAEQARERFVASVTVE